MNDLSKIRKHPLIGVLALAAGLLFAWRAIVHKPADAATRDAPAAIAVDTAAVGHADVPIYLQGLGTVQAFYTVTVKARVDGELQKIGFIEGQTVSKGDLLAQIDPRPNQAAFEQAVATKARDAAQLANAKRDLERYTVLQPQDLASKQTVDTQHALVDQLAAQLQIDQAAIDNARTQLDYTRITSPINGRTGIRLIDPGNIVHAADTSGIVVTAALSAGPVAVTTLSRDGGVELDQGKLLLIDNEIDQPTGTAKLKAIFSNEHNTLWPGQFVNARVLLRTDRSALTIPTIAVQLGPNGPFTYVVKSDSTVEVRLLKIGEESGDMTIIKSGLTSNERVVTSNQYRLQAGVHVRDAAAAASAGAKKAAAKAS
jgi:membrane fusion protein, multidrug efflux system